MLTWGSVGVPLLKVRCSEGVESYLDDTSRVFVLSLSGFRIYALWLMLPREVLFLIGFFFTICYWIWDVKPNNIWTFYLWFVILVQFLAVFVNVKELLVKMPADTIDAYSLLHSVFAILGRPRYLCNFTFQKLDNLFIQKGKWSPLIAWAIANARALNARCYLA